MKRIPASIFAIFLIATFIGGSAVTSPGPSTLSMAPPTRASFWYSAPVRSGARDLETLLIAVAESVNPMVVQILSEKVVRRGTTSGPDAMPREEYFRHPRQDGTLRTRALGSGVVVRSDGYVLTNNHVIDGADELEVKLFDGSFYRASVVGADPASDLAIIRIGAENLPAIAFGDIERVRIGQWVLAFGSPLSEDLGNSVTSGIVSALGRTSAGLTDLNVFAAFIQTDAAINPGNSGGPLVDLDGRLIGLNSAIFSRSGGYQGIGFAIPVDVVENVATQLIETGHVTRGYLGILFSPVSPALARALDVPRGAAQVSRIEPDTPAADAGIYEGDVIVAVNGIELHDANQLRTIIGNLKPDDQVDLSYVRNGVRHHVAIALGTRPSNLTLHPRPRHEPDASPAGMEALGLNLRDLTPIERGHIGLSDAVSGVLIGNIDPGSTAYRDAGLRRFDVISAIDGHPVDGTETFSQVYRKMETGTTFIVRVERPARNPDGTTSTTTFLTALTK